VAGIQIMAIRRRYAGDPVLLSPGRENLVQMGLLWNSGILELKVKVILKAFLEPKCGLERHVLFLIQNAIRNLAAQTSRKHNQAVAIATEQLPRHCCLGYSPLLRLDLSLERKRVSIGFRQQPAKIAVATDVFAKDPQMMVLRKGLSAWRLLDPRRAARDRRER